MWVLCEGSQRVLEDLGRVEGLVSDARALGVTDLLVQVYRGGRAWFDSSLADPTPYRELVEANGVDTLAELVDRAHAAGIRVHAWVNVLSLSQNPNAPLIRRVGRHAVHVDAKGRSLLDYPGFEVPPPEAGWYRMGTPGVYLDPAAPGLAAYLASVFGELVRRYPDLDGLHLDYIRHPDVLPFIPGSRFGVGLDFGYGAPSRERFRRETGLRAPTHGNWVNTRQWDEWRREKVTELVATIRTAAQEARPGLLLSAAVFPDFDRAYLSLYQDWKRWLEDGLLEFAVPMAYTLDDRRLRYLAETYGRARESERIWAGVGSWLFAREPERALDQLAILRRAGVEGEALFSYDSIVNAPPLLEALARGEVP
jgi:uncharacterized lipoprotein YddW (UPF0748 family)